MLDGERARIRGFEIIQERATEGIGDLQCRAQHHRKEQEHEHLLAPEQHEGIDPAPRPRYAYRPTSPVGTSAS